MKQEPRDRDVPVDRRQPERSEGKKDARDELERLIAVALASLGSLQRLSAEDLAPLRSLELVKRRARVLGEPATAIVLRDVVLRAIRHLAWTSLTQISMPDVEAERDLLWQRYVAGRTIPDLAKQLDRDERTIQSYLKAARKSLVLVIWAWEVRLRSQAARPASGPSGLRAGSEAPAGESKGSARYEGSDKDPKE